jgi:hypothetical protein
MKIREGAYYRTRGGQVVGPMLLKVLPGASKYPYFVGTHELKILEWGTDGQYMSGKPCFMDLISEVYVSDTPPAVKETEAKLREMMRDPRYWRTREPEFVKRVTEGFRALVGGAPPPDAPLPDIITDQPCKTLRDEFAIAIVATFLSRPLSDNELTLEQCQIVWDNADAMMEARKK